MGGLEERMVGCLLQFWLLTIKCVAARTRNYGNKGALAVVLIPAAGRAPTGG